MSEESGMGGGDMAATAGAADPGAGPADWPEMYAMRWDGANQNAVIQDREGRELLAVHFPFGRQVAALLEEMEAQGEDLAAQMLMHGLITGRDIYALNA